MFTLKRFSIKDSYSGPYQRKYSTPSEAWEAIEEDLKQLTDKITQELGYFPPGIRFPSPAFYTMAKKNPLDIENIIKLNNIIDHTIVHYNEVSPDHKVVIYRYKLINSAQAAEEETRILLEKIEKHLKEARAKTIEVHATLIAYTITKLENPTSPVFQITPDKGEDLKTLLNLLEKVDAAYRSIIDRIRITLMKELNKKEKTGQ